MAVTYGVNLANGVALSTSSAVVYTAPADVDRVVINQARIVNTGPVAVPVSVWVLQSGESEADNFKAIDSKSVGAGDTVLLSEIIGDSINAGGTIKVISGAITSSISMTGTEFST